MQKAWLQGKYIHQCYGRDDSQTGAHMDVLTLEPDCPDGWFWLGHKACSDVNKFNKTPPLLIVRPNPAYFGPDSFEEFVPLIPVTQYVNVWGMQSRGVVSVKKAIYTASNLPSDYVTLGDLFGSDSFAPSSRQYVALHKLLVLPTTIGDINIWNDQNSHAQRDGSMWPINDDDLSGWHYFVAQSGYSKPNKSVFKINMDLVEIID